MKNYPYSVDVPTYVTVAVRAPNAEAASAAAESLVEDLTRTASTCHLAVGSDGAVVSSAKLELLGEGEDRAPDVYEG